VLAARLDLHDRRRQGHDHGDGDAQLAAVVRQRLRVVAQGRGNDARGSLLFREHQQGVARTTLFEAAKVQHVQYVGAKQNVVFLKCIGFKYEHTFFALKKVSLTKIFVEEEQNRSKPLLTAVRTGISKYRSVYKTVLII